MKSYLTPKVDPVLTLSNYEAAQYFVYFYRTNVQMSTPFFEIDPKIRHTCSKNPCQSVAERGVFCFLFFSPDIFVLAFYGDIWVSRHPENPADLKKKTHSSTGWQVFIQKNTRPEFRLLCPKTALTFGRAKTNFRV